eukprot:4620548-Pleurochrysis_carterae.AAC.1
MGDVRCVRASRIVARFADCTQSRSELWRDVAKAAEIGEMWRGLARCGGAAPTCSRTAARRSCSRDAAGSHLARRVRNDDAR